MNIISKFKPIVFISTNYANEYEYSCFLHKFFLGEVCGLACDVINFMAHILHGL
jgi:hypothetical protein